MNKLNCYSSISFIRTKGISNSSVNVHREHVIFTYYIRVSFEKRSKYNLLLTFTFMCNAH